MKLNLKKKKGTDEEIPAEIPDESVQDDGFSADLSVPEGAPAEPGTLLGPFNLPSRFMQYKACYMVQMKRFSKSKTAIFLIFLIIMIPVVAYVLDTKASSVFGHLFDSGIVNQGMYTCLLMLPLLSIFLSALLCGTMLPSEYRERTVYLSLPLPMSRSAFYFGKFLAGFTLSAGTVIGAYGVAILTSLIMAENGEIYTAPILYSLGLALCGCFFFCAFTYGMSARAKRSSMMKAFIIMFVALPIIAVIVPYLGEYIPKSILDVLTNIVKSFPVFLPDFAVSQLGTTTHPMFITASVAGYLSGLVPVGIYGSGTYMVLLAIIIGCCSLFSGYGKVQRRDM